MPSLRYHAPMRRVLLAAATFVVAGILAVGAAQPREAVTVWPTFGIAGNYGTWTVTYTVGPGGIAPGGALRVQLPDTWHAGERNSANRLQASDPADDHYIAAYGSGTDVRVEAEVESESSDFLVKSRRPGLDGRAERYVFVVRADVVSGSLREGETIQVVYGDTSRGSRGMRAAIVATDPEPILVSVDRDGSGVFEPVSHDATLTSRSGIAADLLLAGPSQLVVGEPGGTAACRGRRALESGRAVPRHGDAARAAGRCRPAAHGRVPVGAGLGHRALRAAGRGHRALGGLGPRRPAPRPQQPDGGLRRHAGGADLLGRPALAHRTQLRRRGQRRLRLRPMGLGARLPRDDGSQFNGPVRARASHAGLGPHVWEEYTAATDAHHAPGEFVTLHAYEASFPAPWGHHNVYFRGAPGPLLSPSRGDAAGAVGGADRGRGADDSAPYEQVPPAVGLGGG